MGVGISTTNFCYLQCDESNCGKKMHHYGERVLKQMARLLGWENRGEQWFCPDCAKRIEQETSHKGMADKPMETSVL